MNNIDEVIKELYFLINHLKTGKLEITHVEESKGYNVVSKHGVDHHVPTGEYSFLIQTRSIEP